MRYCIILTIAMFCTACMLQGTTSPVPVVEEEVLAKPFVEPTATPDCLHAAGVTLDIRPVTDSSVNLHVIGLGPGERPTITYSTVASDVGASRVEMYDFAEGADENGDLSLDLYGLKPLKGSTSATWEIRLIHASGVECATITMP